MKKDLTDLKRVPKVLVITMYSGEPQIERCLKSVEDQIGVSCTHKIISHKPNVEAHKELYCTINSNTSYYDYFIKLDADMELSSEKTVLTLLKYFKKDTDYITIPVFDFMTNDDMPDLHIFSNRVTINTDVMDELYVDKVKVSYPGIKRKISASDKLVFHCKDPNVSQSVAFGIHRALKVVQYDRFLVNMSASKYHFITLKKLYENYLENGSSNLISAINAANSVLLEKSRCYMEDKQSVIDNVQFDDEKISSDAVIFQKYTTFRLLKVIGFKRGCASLFVWLVRKIVRVICRQE